MGINTMQHPNSECEGIKIINWSNLGLRGLKNSLKTGASVTVYPCEGDLNPSHWSSCSMLVHAGDMRVPGCGTRMVSADTGESSSCLILYMINLTGKYGGSYSNH